MKQTLPGACRAALLCGAALALGACTTTGPSGETEQNRTGTGAIVGAVVGAVIGNQANDRSKGRVIGAAAGAIAGGAIGNAMDEQEREFKEELASEQAAHQVEIERVREDLLKLTLDSEVSFDFDSAALKPAFSNSLNKLAQVLMKHDRSHITVVGHTDSKGSESYNRTLSLRRADAVANYLRDYGVAAWRLRTEGRGESEPRASNASEAGRQLNRRVEVFVQPAQD